MIFCGRDTIVCIFFGGGGRYTLWVGFLLGGGGEEYLSRQKNTLGRGREFCIFEILFAIMSNILVSKKDDLLFPYLQIDFKTYLNNFLSISAGNISICAFNVFVISSNFNFSFEK